VQPWYSARSIPATLFSGPGPLTPRTTTGSALTLPGSPFPKAQNLPDANKAICNKLKNAGIESAYLAVEATDEPGAIFMDVGNLRQHRDLGRWLDQYALDNWGGQVDLVILGAQPRAGEYVGQREVGYIQGIREVLPDLPDEVFQTIDTQGILAEAQTQAADLLTAMPDAKYIIGAGTNDDVGVGITRALEAAGRGETAATAGQAGQASAIEELSKDESIFKVSSFQEVEAWLWALAIGAISKMRGIEAVAPNNLMPYYITTKENIGDFPQQIVYSAQ
jgi:ABC-type sugar transport system substrate-binding protein